MKIKKVTFTHTGITTGIKPMDWYFDAYGEYCINDVKDAPEDYEIVTRTETLEDWKPKEGGSYFCIVVVCGDFVTTASNWDNAYADNRYLEANNCFPTRELAEQKLSEIKKLLNS